MTTQASNPLEAFAWKPEYEAEKLVQGLVNEFLEKCPAAKDLARRMKEETGTRFGDWVDHIAMQEGDNWKALEAAGFKRLDHEKNYDEWEHPGGMFPRIILHTAVDENDVVPMSLGIKVESVVDFLVQHGIKWGASGAPLSPYRYAGIYQDAISRAYLEVIERHGYRGYEPVEIDPQESIDRLKHYEAFILRERTFLDDESGFDHAHRLVDAAIRDLGRDMTCDLWFAAERTYWMRRNRAAQVQYARQQRLGLGWANHDHHTYRSSREYFSRLVGFFEKLGFVCRERFYAGREAGWGAQVMEQAVTGIITFNDVDLSPDELMGDFAHERLGERKELGTVGLWCGLHGESFLQAGMHHLEAQFDFEALRKQLEEEASIKTMKPFTDFPYLRQAFTEGERWRVAPERIERLLSNGQITAEQAKQFSEAGAIGSHLENLERNAGFKGFNQKGVSEIISATDPRKQK